METRFRLTRVKEKFPGMANDGLFPTIQELANIDGMKKSYDLASNLRTTEGSRRWTWLNIPGIFSRQQTYPFVLQKKEKEGMKFIEYIINSLSDGIAREEMNDNDKCIIISGAYYFIMNYLKNIDQSWQDQSTLIGLIEGKFDFENASCEKAIMLDCIVALSEHIDHLVKNQAILPDNKQDFYIASFREEIKVIENALIKQCSKKYEDEFIKLDDSSSEGSAKENISSL